MRRSTLAATVFLLAVFPGSSGSQETGRAEEPPVVFAAGIEQIIVDAVVMDEGGQPITDLGEADIEIYEDGVRQTTTSFSMFEVELPASAEGAAPLERPRVSSNADEDEVRGRTFAIVFDDVHLTEETAGQARAAVAEFLGSETRHGDRITLVAPGAGAWWNTRMVAGRDELLEVLPGLQGLLHPDMQPDRLSDYEAMRVHVFRDTEIVRQIQRRYARRGLSTASQAAQNEPMARVLHPNLDPYILAKAARSYSAITARDQVTLEAMERVLASLVRRQGRKSMIVVSEGFVYDPKRDEFKRILTASLRANTAIYFLNSRGLQAAIRSDEDGQLGPSEANIFTREFEEAGGSVTLAQDSGGFVTRDTDDPAVGLRRVANETGAYYLIGYNPINTAHDGRFRKIEVKVPARQGLEVRSRKGYYAPSDDATASALDLEEDGAIQGAMDSPYPAGDIGLRMTHFVREETSPRTARVSVAAEADVKDLHFEEVEGEEVAAFQFVMVAINRTSGATLRYDQRVDLALTPQTRAEIAGTWLPIVRDFEIEAGSYRAKIVLEDKANGRLGSVVHDFKVPEIGDHRLRVSTPVLSDMRTRDSGEQGELLVIMARREFAPEAALYCRVEVYGAARLEASGMPRVTMAYEVRRSDGALYTRAAPSTIEPTPDGVVARTIGFPLRAATAGTYEIVMRVKDELTGRAIDLREPFRVSAPAGAQKVAVPSVEAPSAEAPLAEDPLPGVSSTAAPPSIQ